MKVYLHMYSGNVQQNPLCVESCFTKEYSISPGSRQRCLIPMQIQYSNKHTFLQQQTLCAENPGFKIVQESVKVCTTGIMSSRTLYAQHPVSLRIFHLSPVLAYVFFRRANPAPYSAPFAGRNKSVTEYKMKEVPNIDLRREDTKKFRNGILIGQCAQFLIHPSPN